MAAIPESQSLVLFPVGIPSSLVLLGGVQSNGTLGTFTVNVFSTGNTATPQSAQSNIVAGSPTASLLAPKNGVVGSSGTASAGNVPFVTISPSLYFPVPTGLLLNGSSGPNISITVTSLNAGTEIGPITVTTDSGAPFLGIVTIGGLNASLFSLSPTANVLTSFYPCNFYIAQSNLVANSYSVSLVPTSASPGNSVGFTAVGAFSPSETVLTVVGAQSNGLAGAAVAGSQNKIVGVSAVSAENTFTITEQHPISLITSMALGQAGTAGPLVQPAIIGGTSGLGSAGSALQVISGVPTGVVGLGVVGTLILPSRSFTVAGAPGLGQVGSVLIKETVVTTSGVQSNGVGGTPFGMLNRNTGAGTSIGSAGILKPTIAPQASTAFSAGVAASPLFTETPTISTVLAVGAAGTPFANVSLFFGGSGRNGVQSNGVAAGVTLGAIPVSGVSAVGSANTFNTTITDILASVNGSTGVASLSVTTSSSVTIFVAGAEAFAQTNNISEAIAFKFQGAACAGAAGTTLPKVPPAAIAVSSSGVAGTTSDLIVAFEPGVLAQAMAGATLSNPSTRPTGVSALTSEGSLLPAASLSIASAQSNGTSATFTPKIGSIPGSALSIGSASQNLFETLMITQTGASAFGLANFPPAMIRVLTMSGTSATATVGNMKSVPGGLPLGILAVGHAGTFLPGSAFALDFSFGGVTSQAIPGNPFVQDPVRILGTMSFGAAGLPIPGGGPDLLSAFTTGVSDDFGIGGAELDGVLGQTEAPDIAAGVDFVPFGAIMYGFAGSPGTDLINPIDIISGQITLPPGTATTLTPAQHINIRIKTL